MLYIVLYTGEKIKRMDSDCESADTQSNVLWRNYCCRMFLGTDNLKAAILILIVGMVYWQKE